MNELWREFLSAYKDESNGGRWAMASCLAVIGALFGVIGLLAVKGLFALIPFLGAILLILLLGVLPLAGFVWFVIFIVKAILDAEVATASDDWF